MAWVEPISHNPLIRTINDGFQRKLAKPRKKKEPATAELLAHIVSAMKTPPTLSDVRLTSICLLAYAAFLRIGELWNLRCQDIFSDGCLEVHIQRSKTDQLRQGSNILVARTGNPTCPVNILRAYITMRRIELTSDQYLFQQITAIKQGERLRPSGALSYSRMREIVKAKIRELGYDDQLFGLHSFRAGGATAAANNPTLPERLFKRHGRWL